MSKTVLSSSNFHFTGAQCDQYNSREMDASPWCQPREGHLCSVGMEKSLRGHLVEEGTLELSYNSYVGVNQMREGVQWKERKKLFKAEGTALMDEGFEGEVSYLGFILEESLYGFERNGFEQGSLGTERLARVE